MKTPQLPPSDLARVAPLPLSDQVVELRKQREAVIPHTYNPTRYASPDTLNINSGLPSAASARPAWSIIRDRVIESSTSPGEANANFRTSEALYGFAENQHVFGRQYDLMPLSMGVLPEISFWLRAVVWIEAVPTLLFLDLRISPNLTPLGRKFVFSTMHERVRTFPDLNDIPNLQLGILQFPNPKGSLRTTRLWVSDRQNLFSYADLCNMTNATYTVWQRVLNERAQANRRSAGGWTGLTP